MRQACPELANLSLQGRLREDCSPYGLGSASRYREVAGAIATAADADADAFDSVDMVARGSNRRGPEACQRERAKPPRERKVVASRRSVLREGANCRSAARG